MSSNKPVVVYGASGYTGRLVCEYLREFNVPFLAAGRDKGRVQDVVSKIPGIDTVEHDVVEVEHTVEALTELFDGAQVVCNTVGPFIKYGPEVVEACVAAGAHYLDTTGEQDWVLHAQQTWGQQFADKGLLLSPGVAQMYTTGEIAAQICLEKPGLDTLDILVLWKGFPTYASTQTIFTILKADWYYLEQNQYVPWDPRPGTSSLSIPGQHEAGAGAAVGRHLAPGVVQKRPARGQRQGPRRRPQPSGYGGRPRDREDGGRADQDAAGRGAGARARAGSRLRTGRHAAAGEPAHQHLAWTRCTRPARSAARTASSTATATTSRPACCRPTPRTRCCSSRPRRTGFASACQAFGHRELLGVLRSFGLVLDPVLTVHG